YLTNYLFELSNLFSTFYNQCPVLKAEEEQVKSSRLLLCDLTARVIDNGLSLLGIRTCERM
ncbi:MAG TPA: arginine--tRNA ligase, partial [Gimesia maris]|nr:arginine--tRNA ligase [Gimesia maris]